MKLQCTVLAAVSFGVSVAFSQVSVANAAEVKILTARAIATVLEKVGPDFERTTGHKLNVKGVYGRARQTGARPSNLIQLTFQSFEF